MAMTKEQWIATAGSVVAVGGGIAVQRGWISAAGLSILSGEIPSAVNAVYAVAAVVAAVAPVAYSVWSNFKARRVASVAAQPNESVTTTDATLAAKVAKIDPKATITVAAPQ